MAIAIAITEEEHVARLIWMSSRNRDMRTPSPFFSIRYMRVVPFVLGYSSSNSSPARVRAAWYSSLAGWLAEAVAVQFEERR